MQLYAVGKPYLDGVSSLIEGADYNWRPGGHELRIYMAGITPAELESIRSDPVEFGLIVAPEGLFLIVRFSRASFDCSYSWHRSARVPGEEATIPPVEALVPESRALISIILVEATTGIIEVLRVVTFSPEFTLALHRAIAAQAAGPADDDGHTRWAATMARLTTYQLWDRCMVRCRGGD